MGFDGELAPTWGLLVGSLGTQPSSRTLWPLHLNPAQSPAARGPGRGGPRHQHLARLAPRRDGRCSERGSDRRPSGGKEEGPDPVSAATAEAGGGRPPPTRPRPPWIQGGSSDGVVDRWARAGESSRVL